MPLAIYSCVHEKDLQPPHTCPYSDELGKTQEAREAMCQCCERCERECARDI